MTLTTTYDVERWLALEQVKHYQKLKAAAAATGNKVEYRRCLDAIDIIKTQFGL
ncbi:conserved protein of unknown function [Pseudomonas sp. JV551A1]|uniref:Uncharacterized protein n=1 Tax=Pseudomonas inefficax TaxID=2078786 RepID=A0AAQ1PBG3_9PSED|nr:MULTISPECIES: hypothetical protein [Pseudomonas]SPO56631.1 conserved protein of unknown function [Pseudomonas sp. JV551A1]SPO62783.1 conserved protein of unknown function [Pseudomonas inefficax]